MKHRDTPLSGYVEVPGDKSIGHRALMLAAVAQGRSLIHGLSTGQDNSATARILRQLGVSIECQGEATLVEGVGLDGFKAPTDVLDCGNSGTTMRLMLGLLAGQSFESTLVGDASLMRRPMMRVLEPLMAMGLKVIDVREGGFCPLTVRGSDRLRGLTYESPVASAQVKSAILLAGLYANGDVRVDEPSLSRDHTERMLTHMGSPPRGSELKIPGDLSSAAFLIAASLMIPGSDITVLNVGVNPTRTGFLDVVEAMGADIGRSNVRLVNGEPVADLEVRYTPLMGFELSPEMAVRAIDELPLLAVLASQAKGSSHIRHASELRVKESDRIAKTYELLTSFGVPVTEHADGLTVTGLDSTRLTPGQIDATGDHRIAMCAAIMSLVAPRGTVIHGLEAINSSFPSFFESLETLGIPRSTF